MENGGIGPLDLTLDTRWKVGGQLHAPLANLHLGREHQVPSEQVAEWAAKSVLTLCRRRRTTCSLEESKHESSVIQSLA